MEKSRTYRSLQNSSVALFFYFFNLILQFVSRKVFIDHLGTELLGLNTTALSILQCLNIAESGIGSAVAYTLYKPISEGDNCSINEIVSLNGWLYRIIGGIILAVSIVLMFFFPYFFRGLAVPLSYAYLSFGVLLFSALLGYFLNYKQIFLTASQQDYKVQYSYKSVLIVKVLFQIVSISYLPNGYIWWCVCEFVFAILASLSLNHCIKKNCPNLITSISLGKKNRKKYSVIIKKVKQLFFHKVSTLALTQTSPIIIYAFASLSMVAIYGNYSLVIAGITMFLNSLFNSMTPSIGNLLQQSDKGRTLGVFAELMCVRFLMVSVCCITLYYAFDPFIELWIGEDYILSSFIKWLILINFFFNTVRAVVDSFINALGLFQDIWAPIVEAILNIGLSILLGSQWGLSGIITGVIISQVLIVFLWKPYFLFSKGLKFNITFYIQRYVLSLISLFVTVCVVYFIHKYTQIEVDSWFKLILYTITIFISSFVVYCISAIVFNKDFRCFMTRFKRILV